MALQRIGLVACLFLLLGAPKAIAGGGEGIAGGCGASGSALVCTAGGGDDPAPTAGKATSAPPVCGTQYDTSKPWPSEVRNGELWYYKTWKCQSDTAWRNSWVCASCDPAPIQPPPPDPDTVWNLLVAIAKKPIGRFAPPVEQPGVVMIYGKRLYFRADQTSFTPQTDTMSFPGGWTATGVLTPTGITFAATGNGSVRCRGAGFDGTTRTGRAEADAAGCFLPMTTGPKSGTIASTLSIRWNITVNSNIPGVALAGTTTTTQIINLPIRETQAIVTG